MNKKIVIAIAVLIIIVLVIVAKMSEKSKNIKVENNDIKEASIEDRFDMKNDDNVKIDEGVKKNVSSKISENKNYSDLTISDVKLESNSNTGITEFTATITNNGTEKFSSKNVNIVFLKENETELGKMALLLEDLEPNESKTASSFSTLDIANAYDIRIEELETETKE